MKARQWKGLLIKLGLVVLVIFAGLTIYLDALIKKKFSGQIWHMPAKVYARPLELYAGARLTRDDLIKELEALGYRWGPGVARAGDYSAFGNIVDLHGRSFQSPAGNEPSVAARVHFHGGRVAGLSAPDGAPIKVVHLEPLLLGSIYPNLAEDRILVTLEKAPPHFVDTLLAIEDQNFFHHHGVSLKSMVRALWVDATSGSVVQGGSTLTQQLVKNFYLTNKRTLVRKALEAEMSVLLELHYSKKEILQAYLNEVFLGQDGATAVHGFGLASQYLFGQPFSELQLHQVALLVGLVKGPSYYNPRLHPKRALARRNLILDTLAARGVVSAQAAEAAKAKGLGVTRKGSTVGGAFPAYLDLVKRQLRKDYSEQVLAEDGIKVFTGFDPIKQWKAEAALARALKGPDALPGSTSVEAAMVVVNPANGEVQAVIGGRDPGFAGFNRALDAVRPVGSLIKPAIYLTALRQYQCYNLTSLLEDEPITMRGSDGQVWHPHNYDRQSHGYVPLYEALAYSYNLATARLGLKVGIPNVLDTLYHLGVMRKWPDLPAVLLGAGELTPFEVAGMYQTIANDGTFAPLRSIRGVLSVDGKLIGSYPLDKRKTFDPRAVFLLQAALKRVMVEGTGRGAYQILPSSLALAGKTGTSNDSRDAWFAGFGGNQLAVVWMGRDDNGTTHFTGASGPLRVWSYFMSKARPSPVSNHAPAGITYAWVNRNGQSSAPGCPGALLLPFVSGSEPGSGSECASP